MRTYPNTCKRGCCRTDLGVCYYRHKCACHKRENETATGPDAPPALLMRQEWS